jgi:hypothetical protein
VEDGMGTGSAARGAAAAQSRPSRSGWRPGNRLTRLEQRIHAAAATRAAEHGCDVVIRRDGGD